MLFCVRHLFHRPARRSLSNHFNMSQPDEHQRMHGTVKKHNESPQSIFVSDDAEVHDVPMKAIHRPLPSVLDEGKVLDFVDKIKRGVNLTPIEVAWVEHSTGNYYFAFGGCHRWQAHKRLGSETIRAKLIKVPPSTINIYMGASSPFHSM